MEGMSVTFNPASIIPDFTRRNEAGITRTRQNCQLDRLRFKAQNIFFNYRFEGKTTGFSNNQIRTTQQGVSTRALTRPTHHIHNDHSIFLEVQIENCYPTTQGSPLPAPPRKPAPPHQDQSVKGCPQDADTSARSLRRRRRACAGKCSTRTAGKR